MSIAGHVSHKMRAHYSHIRLEANGKLSMLFPEDQRAMLLPTRRQITTQGTSQMHRSRLVLPRKLLRRMVGPWGLEPQTSTVSR